MAFKVAARTILELGAELISSDAIALYELIKNAIDAGSDSGVEIEFVITLSRERYHSLRRTLKDATDNDADELRNTILYALESDANPDLVNDLRQRLIDADDLRDLSDVLEYAYEVLSYIEISDSGCGMSLKDLQKAFLTIGTPKRAKQIRLALERGEVRDPPALGEKGIGRLSTMRLGDLLLVRTATKKGRCVNELEIDWRDFAENVDAMIEDIRVEPKRAERKEDHDDHGTTLRISRLTASWSKQRIRDVADKQLARISDPFQTNRRRFGIYLTYNEDRVNFTRYVRKNLLNEAHAVVNGQYRIGDSGEPSLKLSIRVPLFGRGLEKERYSLTDLITISAERLGDVSNRTLTAVGPFQFDLYWFNRQRVKKPDGYETRRQFLDLIGNWTGIMLYRDGYQVLPYGDEDTDWLELDRKALSSGGYKLNKAQFVGRVSVSRLANPALVDQTNREGLRDCDEKEVLLHILRYAIQYRLKAILDDCVRAERGKKSDSDNPKLRQHEVDKLAKRAKTTIRRVKPARSQDRILLKEVFELFGDLETRYRAAEKRIEEASDERERLIDLAGIGLIIEMLAHELTRTVEHSADVLSQQEKHGLSPEAQQFFVTLKASMQSIEKRLKIIDPLSVSARQRRRNLDLRRIVDSVIDSHEAQFDRHDIRATVLPRSIKSVPVFAVEGRIIQILENLISNSVYWIKAQRHVNATSSGEITITLSDGPPPGFRFSDSGPGIPVDRSERVFKPFFSTKPERTRQGLGLYIARECAAFHKGSVRIDESDVNERGNLRTFVVEIPDTRKKT